MTTRQQPALCPAAHRDDSPRRAADGMLLCLWHRDRLERHIAELPSLYRACELTLAPGSSASAAGPISGTTDPGLSLSVASVAAREHIRAELHGWCRITLDEGPWDQAPADRLETMAAWLVVRVDWLSARPWADEVARTIADTHGEARRAAYPNPVRVVPIGRCPEDDCEGELTAVVRQADSLLPSDVRCDVNPEHLWTADQWHALGRRMTGAGYASLARRLAT